MSGRCAGRLTAAPGGRPARPPTRTRPSTPPAGPVCRPDSGDEHDTSAHTLRQVQRDGLEVRDAHAEMPPRMEYALTDLGTSLLDAVTVLIDWAGSHHDEICANRVRRPIRRGAGGAALVRDHQDRDGRVPPAGRWSAVRGNPLSVPPQRMACAPMTDSSRSRS
ncbi:helix-turn-helix domain-containing protein [Streptomyces sp. NPDC048663]|uniref:winged helix-turn-helix transcriptional regulator n=1 Tax=Streptomyces sp. NPDC048663 TaxID=3155638 RepID=UPI0034470CDA